MLESSTLFALDFSQFYISLPIYFLKFIIPIDCIPYKLVLKCVSKLELLFCAEIRAGRAVF